jgi:four helix bundle protein
MGDKINSFTNLDTWQEAHKLVIALLRACEQIPRNNSLRNQMERAGISITSNIAEGFGRQSKKDKAHFYVMARGSIFELQNQLLLARDIDLIGADIFDSLAKKSVIAIRLLHGLIRSTNKTSS